MVGVMTVWIGFWLLAGYIVDVQRYYIDEPLPPDIYAAYSDPNYQMYQLMFKPTEERVKPLYEDEQTFTLYSLSAAGEIMKVEDRN